VSQAPLVFWTGKLLPNGEFLGRKEKDGGWWMVDGKKIEDKKVFP
jgi:hypothetical protein